MQSLYAGRKREGSLDPIRNRPRTPILSFNPFSVKDLLSIEFREKGRQEASFRANLNGVPMSRMGQVELMKQAFKYQNGLVSYAYGHLRDWSLAEDAVQDAFLVLMEKWEEFKPELGIFPWVRKMVFYKVQELQRTRRREVPAEDPELQNLVSRTLEAGFDEESGGRHDPLLKAYEECLGRLNKGSAELLTRYYWNRESGERIAGALNRTVNAVWLSLSRIRKSLRECVERRNPELGVSP